jgi:hypothetical protein
MAWDSLIGTVGLGGLWLGRMHATWQAITPATSKPAMAFGLVAHAHTPAYSPLAYRTACPPTDLSTLLHPFATCQCRNHVVLRILQGSGTNPHGL